MSRRLTLSARLVLGIAIAANFATASLAAGLAATSVPRPPVVVLHAPGVARLNLTIASVRSIMLTEVHRNAVSRETPKFYSMAISLKTIEKPAVSRLHSASDRLTEKQWDAVATIYAGGGEMRQHEGNKCAPGDPHGLETPRPEKLRHRALSGEGFLVDAGWWSATCQLDGEGAYALRAWASGCAGDLSFEAVRDPLMPNGSTAR